MKTKQKMYLVIGDWSKDGHGHSEMVLFEVNYTVREIQEAYKASCKLTTLSLNHTEDYTGVKRDYGESKKYQIATDFDHRTISKEALKILIEFKCPLDDFLARSDGEYSLSSSSSSFADFWFWFVSLSLPDLKWESYKENIPKINGFWSRALNVQFGYGLYN